MDDAAKQFKQATENHYRETKVLHSRDDLLFFPDDGVVMKFEVDRMVVTHGATTPDMRALLTTVLPPLPVTNLEKINQSRAWKYLFNHAKSTCFDYGDPGLFKLIDGIMEAENGKASGRDPQDR